MSTPDALLDRLCRTIDRYLGLGCESTQDERVLWQRNRDWPRIYDANHGCGVRAESEREIERVLRRADELYADLSHRFFYCDPLTSPAFEARLVLDGYTVTPEIQLLLTGELRASPPQIDIRLVEDDEGWETVERLTRANHLDEAARRARTPHAEDVSLGLARLRRSRAPAERTWLARVEDVDCAFFSSWPGEWGIGKVEDLFTLPEFRHRGVATALIDHAVADARARGAGPVTIAADPTDTPMQLYARLGFRPACMRHGYLRSRKQTEIGS